MYIIKVATIYPDLFFNLSVQCFENLVVVYFGGVKFSADIILPSTILFFSLFLCTYSTRFFLASEIRCEFPP